MLCILEISCATLGLSAQPPRTTIRTTLYVNAGATLKLYWSAKIGSYSRPIYMDIGRTQLQLEKKATDSGTTGESSTIDRRGLCKSPPNHPCILALGIWLRLDLIFPTTLVFANLANYLHCPHEEICPESPLVNITTSSHYYIEFPATRLVFVSSLSSTLSFALVGALMSVYAYCAAGRLTRASVSPNQNKCLPTSYQTSVLIRILNADYLALWELSRQRLRSGTKAKCHVKSAKPSVLKASTAVLCLAVLASIFVHVADTYLHIAAEAVNLVQIFPQAPAQNRYGRTIDPWCFDNRETMGTEKNKNFWSCALASESPPYEFNNPSSLITVTNEAYSKFIMNFTEETGNSYAVVGPATSPSDADWQATSFAVSSQCVPIPVMACEINMTTDAHNEEIGMIMPFNCSIPRGSPIDWHGTMEYDAHAYSFFDFHRYIEEGGTSFQKDGLRFKSPDVSKIVLNATEQQATQMFPSTWRWTAAVTLNLASGQSSSVPEDMIDQIWPLPAGIWMVVACNSTVYDVTYSTAGGVIKSLTARESNATVAGISILPSIDSVGIMGRFKYELMRVMNPAVSLDSWISGYEMAMSILFATPLAAYTVPADSLLVQTRAQKIMTRVPVAAVWLLVLANLFFAALGIGLAIMAWRTADQDIYQVRTRLGVPGLAAALFERNSENRIVKSDKELFQENDKDGLPLVLVGVQHTVTGGMAWSLRENQTGRPRLAGGAKTSTVCVSALTGSTSDNTVIPEDVTRIPNNDAGAGAQDCPLVSPVLSQPVTLSRAGSTTRRSIVLL